MRQKQMDTLGGKNVLVLGLGVSGLAAARLAHSHGAQVTVLDSSTGDSQLFRAEQLRSQGINVELGWTFLLPWFG
jgi:UDP-N-acetylmuramoylalanine--D-glutamate ligase